MKLWHHSDMSAKRVRISFGTDLLRRIDADPESRRTGRSTFIRAAIETYLTTRPRREIDAQIATAYDGCADQVLEEVADLIGRTE